MNRRLSEWPTGYISNYLTEKAAVMIQSSAFVDPAYTSKICPSCGRIGIKGYLIRNLTHDFVVLSPPKTWQNKTKWEYLSEHLKGAKTIHASQRRKITHWGKSADHRAFGFLPNDGGTAFMCTNALCEHHGHIIDRDIVGSKNIAQKNNLKDSLNRINYYLGELNRIFRSLPYPNVQKLPIIGFDFTNPKLTQDQILEKMAGEVKFILGRLQKIQDLKSSNFIERVEFSTIKPFHRRNFAEIFEFNKDDLIHLLDSLRAAFREIPAIRNNSDVTNFSSIDLNVSSNNLFNALRNELPMNTPEIALFNKILQQL